MKMWEFKIEIDNAETLADMIFIAEYLKKEVEKYRTEVALYNLDDLGF